MIFKTTTILLALFYKEIKFQSLTVLSSFVMARESIGSDRLRSERYPSSLFSSSGSGALSVSPGGGTGAEGAGLSLLAAEPSVLLPPSDQADGAKVIITL